MADESSIIKFLKKNWLWILLILYIISPFDLFPEGLFGPIGLSEDVLIILIKVIGSIIISRMEAKGKALPDKEIETVETE